MISLVFLISLAGQEDDLSRETAFRKSDALRLKILRGDVSESAKYLDTLYEESQEYLAKVLKRKRYPRFRDGNGRKKIGIVVHYTANTGFDSTIRYFISEKSHASTHFVCDFDGTVALLFPHADTTFHAGSPFNDFYFGFDFVNAGYFARKNGKWVDYVGREYTTKLPLFGADLLRFPQPRYGHEVWMPTTRAQVESLIVVGRALRAVYGIDRDQILTHSEINKTRSDCGPSVPLAKIREEMFTRNDLSASPWLKAFGEDKSYMIKHLEPEYGYRGEEIKSILEKRR